MVKLDSSNQSKTIKKLFFCQTLKKESLFILQLLGKFPLLTTVPVYLLWGMKPTMFTIEQFG